VVPGDRLGAPVIITVRGVPAPQGSKRHVGGGRMVEMSRSVGPWREAVRAETQRAMGWEAGGEPLTGPASVFIAFFLPRPKGHFGTGRNAGEVKSSAPPFPAGRPDLDKLVRAVLDGLTAGGAWADDSQVVELAARKEWGTPGCEIEITKVEWS
jgi:crossover junction endodeoxyribonuclease RusA